ncbi:hypothetical protein IAU60_003674 [Kwoniella sp. DSM 27419]
MDMPLPQQRYSAVPGFGPDGGYKEFPSASQIGRRQSGFDFDQYPDSSPYHTPQLLNSTSSQHLSRSTSDFKELPSPPTQRPTSTAYERATAGAVGAGMANTAAAAPLMGEAATARPFASDYARQNIPSEHYYSMSDQPLDPSGSAGYSGAGASSASRSRRRWWIIGGVVLAILAIIGIIVGVVVSQVNKNHKSSSSSSGDSSTSGNGTLSTNGDPSNFKKDDRLHQSFWGFAYTPQSALPPWCGATQQNVTRDIQLLSQITTRLRLYGANCNQTALVLQAIQDTKVDMTVWLGIYVDSDESAYDNQVKAVTEALKTYGTDHVSGITVGNEYILNTATTASTTSAAYRTAVKTISDKIQEVNSTVQALGLDKVLPIGTSDAGSLMSASLGEEIDYFMANVHPWFGSVSIDAAATWTYDFFQEFDVEPASLASNKPATYIAETGWPTQSMNASESNSGFGGSKGEASVANLQTFLDTFVCQANANGTEYFYFEAFDEPWKAQFGGVEPYWGLFDENRNLKDVTIPTCS